MALNLLSRYVIALTNLYGIVHKDLVREIYNQQNAVSVTINQVEALLKSPPPELAKAYISNYSDYFVSSSVLEFDEFDDLLKQKINQPYYRPDQAELLKYQDDGYFEENEAYCALYNFIKKYFYDGDDAKTQRLAEDIQGLCAVESDINTMINEFHRRNLRIKNHSQREEAIRLIEDLAENTRLWSNNGYTMVEMQHNFEKTVFKLIHNFNIEQAVARQPVHDLLTTLGFHSVDDLREISKILNMNNISKLKKKPLMIAMMMVYSRPDVIEYFLKFLRRESWDYFLATVKVEKYVVDNPMPEFYLPLQKLCLVQLFYYKEELVLVVSDEIKQTFAELEKTGFVEKKQMMNDHFEFATAAINLYGIINLDEYVNLFNRMKNEQIDKNQVYNILNNYIEIDIDFFFWNDYLVSSVFSAEENDEITNLLQEQRGKPRYVPALDEFLLYSDSEYYEETPQLEVLEDYLSDYIDDEDELMEIIDTIHELCMDEASPTEHLDFLRQCDIEFEDIDSINEILQMIADVHNNTRIWENNGFTPNELVSGPGRAKVLQFPTGKPVTHDKVGRNDPCPCGSGKKYKNCCGK
jgi:hypothetical protein